MSTYVIGDVQGCWDQLQELLEHIPLNPGQDSIWLTGDLVNRGPHSLEVLRWASTQGPRLRIVLGNHDLKLLGCALGVRSWDTSPTLEQILKAPDRDRLIEWLLAQPLLVQKDSQVLMVHAGLEPAWSRDEALNRAREAEQALKTNPHELLAAFASRDTSLPETHGARTLEGLTLTRMVDSQRRADFKYTGPPEDAPAGYEPWFAHRPPEEGTILFGHWAALGFHATPKAVCLDSGCVWGGSLTAFRLEDQQVFSVPGYAGLGTNPHKSNTNP